MKYLDESSSGMMINIADFLVQNFSASISVSLQRMVSSSESRNALSRESAVDMTENVEAAVLITKAGAVADATKIAKSLI